MINQQVLDDVSARMCQIEPYEWLLGSGVVPQDFSDWLDSKKVALDVMIKVTGDEDECIKASTAAAFQVGFEAAAQEIAPKFNELADVAQRTTIMGTALATCLDKVIDILIEDGGYVAELDQIGATLRDAYVKAGYAE
jgi:histone H3/H4